MRTRIGLVLILLILLSACTSAEELSTPAATITPQVQPTATRLPDSPQPTAASTPVPALGAQTTFEVVAAMHAYVLMLDDWADQGVTLFERQTMLQRVLEIGMSPLGDILAEYNPDPGLADSWISAAEVYTELYPQAHAWVAGDLSDQDFIELMSGIREVSRQMIEGAVLAAGPLGVETSRYGPGYAGAVEVAFTLQQDVFPSADAGSFAFSSPVPLEEMPVLQAVEVQPFLYPFAGSEILLVIGLVENTGLQPQQGVEVEIRFYNFLDEHLGTSRGRLLAATANPGGIYPFSTSTVTEGEETALKDWTHYEVTVYARAVESESYQDFDLVSSAVAPDSSGRFAIEGELTNTGDKAVQIEAIRVGVMALGGEGGLVGVGQGAPLAAGPDLTGGVLAPGDSVHFQAVIEAVSAPPAKFQFFAEVVSED